MIFGKIFPQGFACRMVLSFLVIGSIIGPKTSLRSSRTDLTVVSGLKVRSFPPKAAWPTLTEEHE